MIPTLGKALLVTVLGVVGLLVPDISRARVRPRRVRAEEPIEPAPQHAGRHAARPARPPVLLTTPAYYGTLAAVRSLGRAAIPVTTAGPSRWAVSGWSKYATSNLSCPKTTEPEHFLAWLEDFAQTHEKHVLLPTCDDTAWLFALHRERLSKQFYLRSPGISAIHALLHKGQLAEHAQAVGLDVPRTWFPTSERDLDRVAAEARFPVLLKPVTQVLFASRSKGVRIDHPEQLHAAYREFASLRHGAAIVDYDPSSAYPMIQEFFPDASQNIYNISSYAREGKLWGARAGRKVLQQPKSLGIGLCFEEARVEPRLAEGLERLTHRVGFWGVFEAEFVRTGKRDVLIDFNPRFYNQMGFDVARGLPLPAWAYYDALADSEFTPDLASAGGSEPTGKIFANGTAFKLTIASQQLSGALSADEAAGWRRWYAAHQGRRVDAVEDPDDVWPGRFDRARMLHHHLRHPRKFLSSIVFDR
jgi:predicted ATP-grasp superfamily ATP-dependent carboligase